MSCFVPWRIGVLLSAVAVSVGNAQTRFEWPQQQADVGKYQLWDQCLGAARRINDSAAGGGTVLRDTLPQALFGPFHHQDQEVVTAAQRCAASLPLSSVTTKNTLLAQNVLLVANRDAEVVPLYRKRFAAASTDSAKIDVVTSTVRLLLNARPARLLLADSLLNDITPYDAQRVVADKLDVLGKLCYLSDVARNEALVTKHCGRFLSIVDNMTDGEVARYGANLSFAVMRVERILRRLELQDSLAKSSQAYVSLGRAILTKAFRGWGGNQALGEIAEPLVGEFWFPESARGIRYPRPGRITVVVGTNMGAEVSPKILADLVMLRRIAKRFPTLDIVALSGTSGNFGVLAPPPPAVQAELNYKKVVDFYKIPLVMAVTISPTWRLSDPDRRRIFDPYNHSETYYKLYQYAISVETNAMSRLCKWGCNEGGNGVLIDADGVIIDYVSLDADREEELATLIEILLKRTAK